MSIIRIFGATGYLGGKLAAYYRTQGWEVRDSRVDIVDISAVREALITEKPDVVLNAAGKTGRPNVDWCESHAPETIAVNVVGALNIALVCAELDLYMAHIGSGCIYAGDNGGKGFTEEDEPNFYGSLYSRTKAYSEKVLKEFNPLQLRVRIPISEEPSAKNVIDKLLKYPKIISVENSFTVVEDFLPATYALIERRERGIYNMTNVGHMHHEWLMTAYREIVDPQREFVVMSLDELATVTKAPRSNCVLDVSKREALGVAMPEIQGRAREVLGVYGEARSGV